MACGCGADRLSNVLNDDPSVSAAGSGGDSVIGVAPPVAAATATAAVHRRKASTGSSPKKAAGGGGSASASASAGGGASHVTVVFNNDLSGSGGGGDDLDFDLNELDASLKELDRQHPVAAATRAFAPASNGSVNGSTRLTVASGGGSGTVFTRPSGDAASSAGDLEFEDPNVTDQHSTLGRSGGGVRPKLRGQTMGVIDPHDNRWSRERIIAIAVFSFAIFLMLVSGHAM